MSAHPKVVVVGSYVQDLTWKCRDFPRPGETTVGVFKTGPGGKGSNQAVAAGRAGVDTLFVGAVGCDDFAAQARSFYRAADVPAGALRHARVVVSQLESNLATTAHVLKTAHKAGATTVLNPAPMRPDFSTALLAQVDILIPNETEFAALVNLLPKTGVSAFGEAAIKDLPAAGLHDLCRKLGVPVVIVTLGSRGCFVSRTDGYTFIPAHTGLKVVDTTGAGDAFVGGFAAGLVSCRGDIVDAARFGNIVAALSVTKFGTAPAMPRVREIARFLRAHR